VNNSDEAEVMLLWTGGWDSTFRLLYLVFVEKRIVQPFYILDTERSSTLHELRAMHVIREEIARRSSRLADLIKPTIIVSVHDIKPDPEITAKFNRLREKHHIGSQYEWLARFARHWKISNLELGVHKGDHAYDLLSKYADDSKIKQIDKNDDASIFSYLKKHGFVTHLGTIDHVELALLATSQLKKDLATEYQKCLYFVAKSG